MGCVYQATNLINGKRYIGKTVHTLLCRKKSHESSAKNGSSCYFHSAIRKYGLESFEWIILYRSNNNEDLLLMEQEFIRLLETKVPAGYNLTDGGEGGHHLEETRAKMSRSFSDETKAKLIARNKARAGRSMSCEFCEAISKRMKGRKFSEEHRANISKAAQKRKRTPIPKRGPPTEEHRRKIADGLRGQKRGPTPQATKDKIRVALTGRVGRKHSLETRAKMSAAMTGLKRSPEACARISAARKGTKASPETRAKLKRIAATKKGISLSLETRMKMSAATKGRSKTLDHRKKISDSLKARCQQLKKEQVNAAD